MAINQNNLIEAPVGIEDLQQLVPVTLRKTVSGELQQVLSNNLGTIIKAKVYDAIEGWTVARRTHINMWARFKPVCLNKVFTNDELNSSKEWKQDSTWWKGSGNCGITFFSSTTEPCMPSGGFPSVAALKAAIDSDMIIWKHEKPDGGDSQPFRITDFIQYKHDALSPLDGLTVSTAVLSQGHSIKASVIPTISEWLSLSISDLSTMGISSHTLGDFYFTVAFFDTNGVLKLIWRSDKRLNQTVYNDDLVISIPFNSAETGGYDGVFAENNTYKMYGFLSYGLEQVRYTTDQIGGSKTYIPLPYLDMTEGTPFGIGAPPRDMVANGSSYVSHIDANLTTVGSRIVDWTIYTYGTSGITNAYAKIVDVRDSRENPVTGVVGPFDITTAIPQDDTAHYSPGGMYHKARPLEQLSLPNDYGNIDNYQVVIQGGLFTFKGSIATTPIADE